jgi:hypothetical protein
LFSGSIDAGYVRERTDQSGPAGTCCSRSDLSVNEGLGRVGIRKTGGNMYSDWNRSSNGLPGEGQQIEFVLDHRNVAMEGTYVHQVFHTHWAEYAIDRVRSWRELTAASDQATPARNQTASVLSSASRRDASQDPLHAGGIAHAA